MPWRSPHLLIRFKESRFFEPVLTWAVLLGLGPLVFAFLMS